MVLKVAEQRLRARMAQIKGERMKQKKKKPTNKEVLEEINYLGHKVVETHMALRNLAKVVDMYILFRKQNKKFPKFIEQTALRAAKEAKKVEQS